MEVYIEYVIIDNLIINYFLLKVSYFCSRVKTSKLKILTSSGLGTIVAVIMPFLKLNNLFLILLKINLGFIMVIIGGKFLSVKRLIVTFFYFMGFTFLSGGVLIALFYFADIDYEWYFSVNYNSFIPIGISILVVFLSTKGCCLLVEKLLKVRDIEPFVRKCVIVIGSKRVKTNGFIDSGNRLYDFKTGLPIIVMSNRLYKILNSGDEKLIEKGSIEIDTVNGQSTMKIYILDKLMIYNGEVENIFNNVLIGKSQYDFTNDENYDLLLNPSLI